MADDAAMHGEPGAAPTRPVTVVTGGSEGIGLAIAHRFAALGHELLLIARSRDRLEAAAAEIRARHAVGVATLALDLTAPDALARLDATLVSAGSHVNVLVNNAGLGLTAAFADCRPSDLDHLIALNATVPTRLMRHVLPGMLQRKTGGVLNIASLGGLTAGPYQAAYYASKAYLISLSEAVASEISGQGVRISVVVPGPVATEFHTKMRADSSYYRWLLPTPSAAFVAWWAVRGYRLGLRLVIPGLLMTLAFAGLRILPHRIVIPIVGWLLKPRTGLQPNGGEA